jgi:hypothetical protein
LATTTTLPVHASDNGVVTVICDGENVTLEGLPVGEYTVSELAPAEIDGYTYDRTTMNGTEGTTVTVQVTAGADEAANVAVINFYKRDKGSVYIEKTVTVNGTTVTDENRSQVDGIYSFTVTSDKTVATEGEDPDIIPAVTKNVTITISDGVITEVGGDASRLREKR